MNGGEKLSVDPSRSRPGYFASFFFDCVSIEVSNKTVDEQAHLSLP